MTELSLPPGYLGAVTEARFAAVFGTTAIATAKAAADLIGIDEKTLGALTEEGIIRSVPKGARRHGYTERDLRTYLIESTAGCRSTSQRRAVASRSIASAKVIPMSAMKEIRPDAARKRPAHPGSRGR